MNQAHLSPFGHLVTLERPLRLVLRHHVSCIIDGNESKCRILPAS